MIKFKDLCFDGHACMSHLNADKYVYKMIVASFP